MLWPIDEEDLKREDFYDTAREYDAVSRGVLEYLPFTNKKKLNAFLRRFRAIVEAETHTQTLQGDYIITRLKIKETASKEERIEIAKAAKMYGSFM